MKRRSLLAMILSLVMCLGLAMPAWAAEANVGVQNMLSSMKMLSIADMQKSGNIFNLTDLTDAELFKEKKQLDAVLTDMQLEAKNLVAEINNTTTELPITVEVVDINDDFTYIYSYTQNEEPQLMIRKSNVTTINSDEIEMQYDIESEIIPFAVPGLCNGPCSKDTNDTIPSGHGARLPMKYTNGTIMTFTVDTSNASDTILPSTSTSVISESACYLYGGFVATCSLGECKSDLGLTYVELEDGNKAWRPYYKVVYGKYNVDGNSILSSNDENGKPGQVWGENGFVPGESVQIQIRIDSATNTNGTPASDVVLRTEGLAWHATNYGSGGRTYLAQAMRYKNNGNYYPKMTDANNWRLLACLALKEQDNTTESDIKKGYVAGDFSNIKINNTIPTFQTVNRDFGYAKKESTNSYWLQSCKGL